MLYSYHGSICWHDVLTSFLQKHSTHPLFHTHSRSSYINTPTHPFYPIPYTLPHQHPKPIVKCTIGTFPCPSSLILLYSLFSVLYTSRIHSFFPSPIPLPSPLTSFLSRLYFHTLSLPLIFFDGFSSQTEHLKSLRAEIRRVISTIWL